MTLVDKPNAYISPYGQVIMSTGLLNITSSDDELAAVLSHELSHSLLEHPREGLNTIALGGALAPSLLPMLVGGFYARGLFLTAATACMSIWFLTAYLSRCREEEADYAGMLLMAEAGFDPASRTALWQKMASWKNRCVKGFYGRLAGFRPQDLLWDMSCTEYQICEMVIEMLTSTS